MRCRGQQGRRRGEKVMMWRLWVRRGQQGADRGVNYLRHQSRDATAEDGKDAAALDSDTDCIEGE